MWPWKKNKTIQKNFEDFSSKSSVHEDVLASVLRMLELIKVTLAEHDKEIDMLKARFKGRLKPKPEEDDIEEKVKDDRADGFDDLRKLNKELRPSIGL